MRRGELGLPRELQELRIQVCQVHFNPVVPAAPFRIRLGSAEAQHREIALVSILVHNLGKVVPDIGSRCGCDQCLAIREGNHGA